MINLYFGPLSDLIVMYLAGKVGFQFISSEMCARYRMVQWLILRVAQYATHSKPFGRQTMLVRSCDMFLGLTVASTVLLIEFDVFALFLLR